MFSLYTVSTRAVRKLLRHCS